MAPIVRHSSKDPIISAVNKKDKIIPVYSTSGERRRHIWQRPTSSITIKKQRPSHHHGEANIATRVDFGVTKPLTRAERERLNRQRLSIFESNRRVNRRRTTQLHPNHLHKQATTNRSPDPRRTDVQPPVDYVDPLKLHPRGWLPPDYSELGPVWDKSRTTPGQPGYGYKVDGTPVGSDYIEYVRDQKASRNRKRRKPQVVEEKIVEDRSSPVLL